MEIKPKITVIMPSLNVVRFIRPCIESVLNQSLKEIEILCVDAGSTDGTAEVLRSYEQADSRVRVIESDRKSYGYQMNLGLDAANGDYIGIIETDDWAEPDMFETLLSAADTCNADLVKANYYWYYSVDGERNIPFENLKGLPYRKEFSPRQYLQLFESTPAIWSGIYRREMLTRNGIRFNETPGASYQDASFHFMVCLSSEKALCINRYLHHYRRDNESSSVNSPGKVYCVCDEMHYFEQFLKDRPGFASVFTHPFMALKYEKYRWNYERLAAQFQWEFLSVVRDEFSAHRRNGDLIKSAFSAPAWENVNEIIDDPVHYYKKTCKDISFLPESENNRGFRDKIKALRKKLKRILSYPIRKLRNLHYRIKVDGLRRTSSHYLRRFFKPLISKQLARKVNDPSLLPENGIAVSVIMPVYNVAEYLEQCLDSILSQSLKAIEVICVDDGSTDASASILQRYRNADPRVIILTQENSGAGPARNKGMAIARGKYLSILDSDDFHDPDMLASAYLLAEKTDAQITMFRHSKYDQDNGSAYTIEHQMCRSDFPELNPFTVSDLSNFYYSILGWTWDKLFLRSFVEESGLQFQSLRMYNDMFFTYSALVSAERISYTEDVLIYQRINRKGAISKSADKNWKCIFDALAGIRAFLVSAGKYDQFGSCFRDYAIHMILYTYRQISEKTKPEMAAYAAEFLPEKLGIDLASSDLRNREELEEAQSCFLVTGSSYRTLFSENRGIIHETI